jgi:2-polyprenyl-3-methyl-5-hydroxy-6-metoxy-1,4-benzoquinol methylase
VSHGEHSAVDPRMIQADFDRIAALSGERWDHNSHYHPFLLQHLPPRCESVLDVGCGTGAFARVLAGRSDRVLALDLAPQMIRIARERSQGFSTIDFQVADVLDWDWPEERFDCIASITTLHHLPLEAMVRKMRAALRVGGTLLILDLFAQDGLSDALMALLAVPPSLILRTARTGRLRAPRAVRAAWAEHGRHDSLLTLAQVRQVCAAVLPGRT